MLNIFNFLGVLCIIGVAGAIVYFGILSAHIVRQLINKMIDLDVIADDMASTTLILGSLMVSLVIVEIILFIPVNFLTIAIHGILISACVAVFSFVMLFILADVKSNKDLHN